ncbi:MAG: hypothetical protein GEV07_19170 [Streptosporangiales bacterium]|nr:hypothetical protein [Streptosporangiales bacterium]
MDLTSYAELAVRLVNTNDLSREDGDQLTDLAQLRAFFADLPKSRATCTKNDLRQLRELRDRLRAVFEAVEADDVRGAMVKLNALLTEFPVRPVVTDHDDSGWHLHLSESGSPTERYVARAVFGIATLVTELTPDRLGACQADPCRFVFLDTSTNRSRRYCSDRCATRANVAAYRARRREQAGRATG